MNIARLTVMSLRLMNVADNAEVVGERFVGRKCIEISELSVDVEPQQEGHLGVRSSFPDDDPISIAIGVADVACTDVLVVCREVLAESVTAGGAGTSVAAPPSSCRCRRSACSSSIFCCSSILRRSSLTSAFSVFTASISFWLRILLAGVLSGDCAVWPGCGRLCRRQKA